MLKEYKYRNLKVKENIIDVVARNISPAWHAERIKSKFKMSALDGGGYEAGRRQRGKNYNRNNDANTDILRGGSHSIMVSDSRHLYRNNAIAKGIIDANTINVVGDGIKPHPAIDRNILNLTTEEAEKLEKNISSEIDYQFNKKNTDADNDLNFYELQALYYSNCLMSGDVLAVFPFIKNSKDRYQTKIQIIESDRISNPTGRRNDRKIIKGVEIKDKGQIIYHVSTKHPGDLITTGKKNVWQQVKAFREDGERIAILGLRKERPGQTRGVPYLSNVMKLINEIGKYIDSEQKAAVVSGLWSIFIETPTGGGDGDNLMVSEPDGEIGGQASDEDYKIGYGSMLELAKGQKVSAPTPGRPNKDFSGFVNQIFDIIGMGLNIPPERLKNKYNSNYTAARAADLAAWRFFKYWQAWMINNFCSIYYARWFEEAVIKGYIKAPGFFESDLIKNAYTGVNWVAPVMGQIDPLKEIKAARERIDALLSTREKESSVIGNKWTNIITQQEKELKDIKASELNDNNKEKELKK